MKLLLTLLLALFFICISSFANTPIPHHAKIANVISEISPHVTPKKSKKYGIIIHKRSQQYKIDWKIMVAIIKQESDFVEDVINCTRWGCDFGLVQVNSRNINPMKLDVKRLLFDADYAINFQAKHLRYLKNRYSKKDRRMWFARYHSKTPRIKKKYYLIIKKRIKRIKEIVSANSQQIETNPGKKR